MKALSEDVKTLKIKKAITLSDYEPDTWRYRIGKYRIFYIIEKQIVNIISLDHRKDAYKPRV
jgi:mRNA-degrading endonuclease RelE of RelBE toxin-antitoxin system